MYLYRYSDNAPSMQNGITSKSQKTQIRTWLNFSNTKVPNADTQYVSRALIFIFSTFNFNQFNIYRNNLPNVLIAVKSK